MRRRCSTRSIPDDAAIQVATSSRQILASVYDMLRVEIVEIPTDTFPVAYIVQTPPTSAALASLEVASRFSMTWLLEGSPSYDKRTLLTRFGRDTSSMHRALADQLVASPEFSTALLRLAVPFLQSTGRVVTSSAVSATRRSISRDSAYAFAARFIHAMEERGKPGLTMCAKPEQLFGRIIPRDDAAEAWMYSIVRSTQRTADDLLRIAHPMLLQVRADHPTETDQEVLSTYLWQALVRNGDFRRVIDAGIVRTAGWSPIVVRAS